MQTASVHHGLEFVTASTVLNPNKVVGNSEGGLRRQAALLEVCTRRTALEAWAPRQGRPVDVAEIPECAVSFSLKRRGLTTTLTSRN